MTTAPGWYVRMGRLQGPTQKTRYGPRLSAPVGAALAARLADYSLIIPAFTRRADIPSTKDAQRALPWLWGVYEHTRFFGVLDLDMVGLDRVQRGDAPLFIDVPSIVPYKDKAAVKHAFVERLASGHYTFGQLAAACPCFDQLYRAVAALVTALEVDYALAFFSGGGGFRVLFHVPDAWRQVTWGQDYAAVFHADVLPGLLRRVAPTLAEEALQHVLAATDKNVYDCDKGIKPDLLAHFDTGVFPAPLDAAFEARVPSSSQADASLLQAIPAFWTRVFQAIPLDAPRLTTVSLPPPVLPSPLVLAKKPPPPLDAISTYVREHYPYALMARFFSEGPRYVQTGHLDKYTTGEVVNTLGTPAGLRAYLRTHSRLHVHDTRDAATGECTLELCIDIDVQDYDTHRRKGLRKDFLGCVCATDDAVCSKCWLLCALAVAVLRALMPPELGEPLVVFSGGKGLHLWFGSAKARQLTATQRDALAAEFRRWRKSETLDTLASDRRARAYDLRMAALLAWEAHCDAVLGRLDDPLWLLGHVPASHPGGMEAIRQGWAALAGNGKARWALFRTHAGEACCTRLVLELALPVVDLAVYAGVHTLKLPFSVHKSAPYRLALPLSREAVATCDPSVMPSVTTLALPAHAHWQAGLREMAHWLTACGY